MNNEIENLDGEVWKDIEEFEGRYQVSNKGRVKSLNYKHTGTERLLKPGTIKKSGYQFVILCKNSVTSNKYVHRLVAQAFLPNIKKERNCIDHIDCDPTNNSVENLRWCSQKENCNNPLSKIHFRDAQGGQPIYCYETDTVYESTSEVARQLNVNPGNVGKCCNGKISQTGLYHFCYASELPDNYELLTDIIPLF